MIETAVLTSGLRTLNTLTEEGLALVKVNLLRVTAIAPGDAVDEGVVS